jgi:hypothetical protein
MFSRPLLGTNKKKTKLSWLEYIWFSCIIQGWANFYYAYKNWADLMGNNYQDYALLKDDDPLELCILYFWDSLEDEIYPKDFLEELMQMVDDIDTGKEKVYPIGKNILEDLHNLVDGLIDPVDLNDLLDDDEGED